MTRLPWLVLLPATLVSAAACGKAADETASEKVQAVVGASVATIKTERFLETVEAIGTVIPRAGHVASLAAPGPTRVTGTPVALGARVHAGDLLVKLDQVPFETAARSADAALAAAQSASDRALRLADAGVLPRKDAEQAAAALALARADAATAHRTLDLSAIHSPIDGVVTKLNAMLGASVDVGQTLVDVTDTSVLDVALTLSFDDASRVATGQSVALRASAGADGEAVANGRVVDVSRAVDSTTLGVTVRVELTSGVEAARIGETLFGRVTVGEHTNAVVVPAEALVPDEEGFKVFVVDAEGIALSRPVTIGGRSDRGVWIKTGLKAGERVVTHGAYGVSDSAKVSTGKADSARVPAGKGDTAKSTGKGGAP